MTRRDHLSVKVIKAKYKSGGDITPNITRVKNGSNFWRGIKRSWDSVEENVVWRVGNGRSINCWVNLWIPEIGKIDNFLMRPTSCYEDSLRVCDLVDSQGNWTPENLANLVPSNVIQ